MLSCGYFSVWIFLVLLIKSSFSATNERSSTTPSMSKKRMAELREKHNDLVKAQEQLKIDRKKFEEGKRQMQRSVNQTDVIRLNVGGELIMTTRVTLTRISKSVLATMFNSRWEHKLGNDQNGNIFLDFNPILFRHLLDQLRVLENESSIIFHPPSSSLAMPFEKMLRKLGLDSPSKSLEAVITLDVGGERVTTRHKTLARVPNLKFSSSNKTNTDVNSNRFLDYAPKLFRHLLGQLREEKEAYASGFRAPSNEDEAAFRVILIDLGFEKLTTTTTATITTTSNSNVQLLGDVHYNDTWTENAVTVAGDNGPDSGFNQLHSPYGLFVDDDQTIYIADYGNHRIVEWKRDAMSGKVVAGGNEQGNRSDQLNGPTDVIVDKLTYSLIICDSFNRRVMRWVRRGGTSGQVVISDVKCSSLTMDGDRFIYVSDTEKNEVSRWRVGETSGTVVAGGNGNGDRLDQLSFPTFIFVDRDRSVYVSDTSNHRVMKWVKNAKEGIITAGGQGKGNALTQLNDPAGVTVDQLGTIYVADKTNHRIMRWSKGATQGNIVVGENGKGQQANQLDGPLGLSLDRQWNLYVVDYGNDRIQRFSSNRRS